MTQSGVNIIQWRAWQTGTIYSRRGIRRGVVFSGPVRDFIIVLHQFQSPTQNFSVLYLTAILVIVHVRHRSLVGDESETASREPAPDLDGGGPGGQEWWEAPCADTKCLGRGW